MMLRRYLCSTLAASCLLATPYTVVAQQTLGGITGTVSDQTGAVLPDTQVTILSKDTGLTRTVKTRADGQYGLNDLPIGTYQVSVTREGFNTERYPDIRVQADRTTTLVVHLKTGSVSESITVNGTPLVNAVDTTNGYVLDSVQIEAAPLGTGSFTQLATLSPGVNADVLSDTGTNTGLGNQNIWANGQRLSSNTFTFNSVIANNLFNGASSSQVAANRAVLNTGESFQNNGTIRTNTSIYDAIGEALPTPPQQTIAEERVNTSMFDASQGATAGAHIDVTTKSGTNALHGSVYGMFETSKFNANPFFNKQAGLPTPDLHRYNAGIELGGPIKHDKLFFYASYQYTRARDQLNSSTSYNVPPALTDDRSAAGLQTFAFTPASEGGGGLTPGQSLSPVAANLLSAKLSNGQYLIRSATSAGSNGPVNFIGPASKFQADQANANLDYHISNSDVLSTKYYFQQDPSESPFSSTPLLGFPQKFRAGSQVFSLENSHIFTPNLSWEQKFGFLRMTVGSFTGQPFGPQQAGINLFGSPYLPGIDVRNFNTVRTSLSIGPTSNFANTGFSQNTFEGTSNLNWVIGAHTLSFGANYDFTQLNILNRANQVATLSFNSLQDFLTGGPLRTGAGNSVYFQGASNRYYRAPQVGSYVQDKWRVTNAITITAGLRYDYDGGLYEKYGNLVNFDPKRYSYDYASDTITNPGLIIAGNNKLYHTLGASNSTLTQRQSGIAPRIGLAYSLNPKTVVRAGFGIYYDRGEYFTEFSPSAGNGFNGPFGVTLQPPFVQGVPATASSTLANPFGATPPPIDTNPADFVKSLPTRAALVNGDNPYLFGAYGLNNKLPYTENWSLDVQYQLRSDLAMLIGYTGNHGLRLTVPVPFNQPKVATPQSPVNGETYSYGYNAADANGSTLLSEPYSTSTGGNTDLRAPYIGYAPNSVSWNTVGWANYNALLASLRQNLRHGLEFTVSYTYSHSLDASSGFGLFYNGNDPQNLASGYASSDFDRTHVTSLSFNYTLPALAGSGAVVKKLTGGWGLSGITILESGQPYNVYDFSGTVGSIFFSSNDYLTNPVLPLAPGIKARQALTGHSGAFVNSQGTPVNLQNAAFKPSAFVYPSLAPGESGVPPCGPTTAGTTVCDTSESNFSNGGRNIFRGSFQKRADLSLYKETRFRDRYALRVAMDVFNVTNTPSFDTPGNNFSGSDFGNPPNFLPLGPGADPLSFANQGTGVVTNPIGSPRQVQFYATMQF